MSLEFLNSSSVEFKFNSAFQHNSGYITLLQLQFIKQIHYF